MDHFTGPVVQSSSQIVLLIGARGPDFLLSAFGHPFVTDLGQEVDVQLIGKEKGGASRQALGQVTNPGQQAHALGIIVAGLGPGSFPSVVELVQSQPDRFAGELVTSLGSELKGQGGATPTGAAPAKNRGRLFDQRQERTMPREQSPRFEPAVLLTPSPRPLTPLVSLDGSIDRASGAKEKLADLSGSPPVRTQQEVVKGKKATATGLG